MQQGLGVTTGLCQALEHQLTRCHVSHRRFKVSGHGLVLLVTGVLFVHHSRHALKGVGDLFLGHHAPVDPAHCIAQDALGVVVQFLWELGHDT